MKPSIAFVALQALTAQNTKDRKPRSRIEVSTKEKFSRWKDLNDQLAKYWGQERCVPAKV